MIAVRENETGPGSAPTLARPLTRLSVCTGRGLAVKATRICSAHLCDRPVLARDLCKAHYQQRRKTPGFVKKTWPARSCTVCGGEFVPAGYQQLRCSDACKKVFERAYQAARVRNDRNAPLHARRTRVRKHGITLERFDEMSQEQGGGCAICGGPNRGGRHLEIDHDHACCPGTESCGKCVRGLLCGPCNKALGQFQDNPELLRRAAEYLEVRRVVP